MFINAYDFNGVLVTYSVPAENRVNGAYHSYLLEHNLRPAVGRKHPNRLNSHPIVLRDCAHSQVTAPWIRPNLLRRLNCEILEHPANSQA